MWASIAACASEALDVDERQTPVEADARRVTQHEVGHGSLKRPTAALLAIERRGLC